jgi:hypothetical protein
MVAPMAETRFIAFVPRRLSTSHSNAEVITAQAPPALLATDVGSSEGSDDNKTAATEAEPEVANSSLEEIQALSVPTIETTAFSPAQSDIPVHVCNHRSQIRSEAIRLAVVACGRALRRAVLVHPRVIAAFVDDAFEAAGRPEHARVRVHGALIQLLNAPQCDRIADDEMEKGDVVIECDGTTVGATIEERAELLVRAVADQ